MRKVSQRYMGQSGRGLYSQLKRMKDDLLRSLIILMIMFAVGVYSGWNIRNNQIKSVHTIEPVVSKDKIKELEELNQELMCKLDSLINAKTRPTIEIINEHRKRTNNLTADSIRSLLNKELVTE